MMYVKIHKGSTTIVAICDDDLIGKELREGKLCLKISEYFYKGEKKSEQEVEEIMKTADNLNIVGKRSVAIALRLGIIMQHTILVIQGVPHAQTLSC